MDVCQKWRQETKKSDQSGGTYINEEELEEEPSIATRSKHYARRSRHAPDDDPELLHDENGILKGG